MKACLLAYPLGTTATDQGTVYSVAQDGEKMQFVATGDSSRPVVTQPVRNESFVVRPADSGTIIPIIGNVDATVEPTRS